MRIFATPLVYFTPDTYWAFGAAGIMTFRGAPQRSSVSFSIAYTLRKQLLIGFLVSMSIVRLLARLWRSGLVPLPVQYFGIGNKHPNDYKETYVARYIAATITAFGGRVHRHELAGLRYGLDFYNILEASPGGELASGAVTGTKGGTSSSFLAGLAVRFPR